MGEKDKKKKDKDDKEEEEEKDKKKKKKEDEKDEKEGKGEDEEGKVDLKPPEDASEIVKYGPNSCIWTWKNETTGHCIMKTQCEGQDISKYMFGLMCDSKDEGMVRHLFGEGSFADDESFDTLIPCDKCLALDAPPDVELSAEVKSLKEEVEEIKEGVKELDAKVSHTEGSCVLSTNCDGLDLSAFEFAFDCKAPDGVVQRHSFGFGGFDAQEEFDTSVKCSTCSEPQQTQPQ